MNSFFKRINFISHSNINPKPSKHQKQQKNDFLPDSIENHSTFDANHSIVDC